ncbi:MAG: pantoate--beta-alanine ligase [Akkermansiaceae bacterium]|nr:pantoate--beta-alanine ligase [Akkermansiaceae bacterium]
MQVIRRAADIRSALEQKGGKRVLVPTMGALHEGHLALVEAARREAGSGGCVAVSIYVNPIQFDRSSDLEAYPRTEATDLAACEKAGVDVVFIPDEGEMYAADRSITVTESQLSSSLCGATRPGHFDGVCTVVLKLFMLTSCDAAVFGEKDFQQLAIIRRMVRDLNLPVEIVAYPTLREKDGLAMSSRNARLDEIQRADAPRIHRALTEAKGLNHATDILEHARKVISTSGLARIDYLELVDAQSLQPIEDLSRPAILAAAVFYGEVRLIDHVHLEAR